MEKQTREVARLWTLAQPAVSAFIASMIVDFRDRDDVLQNVAVAVIDSFDSYDPERPFVAWAIGIARNHIRGYWRQRQRDRHLFDTGAMESIAEAFVELAPSVSRRTGFLSEYLTGLGDRARQLCELGYSQGLLPLEIGEAVQMSANAVAKALQRVREQLRECIERRVAAQGE